MSTICMQCTSEDNEVSFPTVKGFVEHEKSGHKIPPPAPIPAPVREKTVSVESEVSKQPIKLEYKYQGNHDTCNNPVDTILIEVGDSFYVIAYCPLCRSKITDQRVIPIERQGVEFTKGKYVIEKKK